MIEYHNNVRMSLIWRLRLWWCGPMLCQQQVGTQRDKAFIGIIVREKENPDRWVSVASGLVTAEMLDDHIRRCQEAREKIRLFEKDEP